MKGGSNYEPTDAHSHRNRNCSRPDTDFIRYMYRYFVHKGGKIMIENVEFNIPKESYVYVIKDGFVEDINNYLLDKLGDCVMKNLVAEGEIIVKLSVLFKEEFTSINSIQFKRQIEWKPLVRCGYCEYADEYNHCKYSEWWNGNADFCSHGIRRRGTNVGDIHNPDLPDPHPDDMVE